MKVPMSWFNDYTDISGVTPKEYAHALTMTGSKVEGVENMGKDIEKVVTGKVLTCEMHPDSDHLHVCTVDAGTGEVLQIVCGAPNVKAGIIVPVALNGSKLPGGVTIKKGKLRGVESNGMLCSHEELGITDADLGYTPEYGILILPEDTPIGMDIKDYFGINEDVVEFEITSNRPDCFSVIGLARETAVTFKKPFNVPKPTFHSNSENISDFISVEVKNTDKCMRYSAKMIKNVKIGPSPKWMVTRLKASGIRSINNIVDITNYILLEYGQPMHAFDLRDLDGHKITVRNAEDGEVIKTLDEQDRVLNHNDLVISDAKKAVAIAGVMGGFNSEVKPDTTTVVFESATFDAASVRLTAQKVGLRTEASSRYEKGLDVLNTFPAVERACQLVEELGCGEIVGGTIDVYGKPYVERVHDFRPDKINAFLGTDIPVEDMVKYLTDLEFKVDTAKMKLISPSFRPDIVGEADIAEEVARIYGYDKIPVTLLSGAATKGEKTPLQKTRDAINAVLTAQGMYEIYTYTFTGPYIYDKLNIPANSPLRNCVKITNPFGDDTSAMRTTSVGSMLDTLSYNFNRRADKIKFFEIAKIFIPTKAGELPDEREIITLGMFGGVDFFDLKGACETMFDALNVKNVQYKAQTNNPTYHPGRCAEVFIDGKYAGTLGEIHPDVSKKFNIGTKCYVAEISLAAVFDAIDNNIKFEQLPKFPAVTRDIAMLVDKNVPVAEIEEIIVKASGKLLDTIKLFDVYEGSQIPEDKKSIAYSVSFRAADRNLTNEEINVVFDKILKKLESGISAQLR